MLDFFRDRGHRREPARHQKTVDRIRARIWPVGAEAGFAVVHVAGVYVAFPDGSLKRPDIALFRREQDEAITLLPEAVIKVISRGYEAKDLEIEPRFYLFQGVKDVMVFDPHTFLVLHIQAYGTERLV